MEPSDAQAGGRSIKRIGFFHFGSDAKTDPVGSLEAKLNSASDPKLRDTLLVLPEAFNVRGGFYSTLPELDHGACSRLRTISAERRVVFIAGIIDSIGGSNSAYLFDGRSDPKFLTSKANGGRDGLYAGCEAAFTPINCGGLGIGVLICDDAMWSSYGEPQQRILTSIKGLGMEHSFLCIPACMSDTDAFGVARRWGTSISVVLANGDKRRPSVLIHNRHPEIAQERLDKNEIQLCDLEPDAGAGDADRLA
jgi:predicted amidohydrolase